MPWRWIIAFVWLVIWSFAARGFWGAAEEQKSEAARFAEPPTGLEPGADVRVQVRVAPGPKVRGPLSQKEGVAVVYSVSYTTSYLDSQNKTQYDSSLIVSRTLGGPVWLETEGKRLVLPTERFDPDGRVWPGVYKSLDKLPAELHVSSDDVEKAKARTRGQFHHYGEIEYVVEEGMSLFVVGRLEPLAGPNADLRLTEDPVLHKIMLFPGTQAELVAKRKSSSSGLRVAGYIVLGLGFLPAVIFSILFLRKKLRGADPESPPAAA